MAAVASPRHGCGHLPTRQPACPAHRSPGNAARGVQSRTGPSGARAARRTCHPPHAQAVRGADRRRGAEARGDVLAIGHKHRRDDAGPGRLEHLIGGGLVRLAQRGAGAVEHVGGQHVAGRQRLEAVEVALLAVRFLLRGSDIGRDPGLRGRCRAASGRPSPDRPRGCGSSAPAPRPARTARRRWWARRCRSAPGTARTGAGRRPRC